MVLSEKKQRTGNVSVYKKNARNKIQKMDNSEKINCNKKKKKKREKKISEREKRKC